MLKRSLLVSTLAFACSAATASASLYFNGFETNTAGWSNVTRVASGTNGVASSSGGFHATLPTTASAPGSLFTQWGGYNFGAGNAVPTTFQEYWTSVDIYLDVSAGLANNSRFDFSSAINNSAGTFLQDFIFNGGFYNDATGPGAGTSRFVFSASNNSQPGSAFAKNPARNPIAISSTGWYTFEHHFYNNAGVLEVGMSILDSSDAVVGSWTLLGGQAITAVGGNRYGWFDYNQISSLAFDNTELRVATASVPDAGATLAQVLLGIMTLVGGRRLAAARRS